MATPIENAASTFRALRRKGYRRLSRDERIWYFTCRALRNYTARWRSKGKRSLDAQVASSLNTTREWLGLADEFRAWWGELEAKAGSSPAKTRDLIADRLDGLIEPVREQLELSDLNHDAGETEEAVEAPYVELVVEEVLAAAALLGLDPCEEWLGSDDGAVWCEDPATGDRYFALIGLFEPRHNPYRVASECLPLAAGRRHPAADLMQTALSWSTGNLPDLARHVQAYSGAIRGLRKAAEAAGPPPIPLNL